MIVVTETFLGSIWQDVLALGILVGLGLVIYAKMKKQTVGEVIREIREAVKPDG